MKLKPGVSLLGLRPEAWAIIHAADPIWQSYGLEQGATVTSGVDGEHMRASEHYSGHALDLRTHDLPPDKRREARSRLVDALGADYVVLLEYEGTANEHVHAHWRPRRGVNQ